MVACSSQLSRTKKGIEIPFWRASASGDPGAIPAGSGVPGGSRASVGDWKKLRRV
jgi:hypothetical protein